MDLIENANKIQKFSHELRVSVSIFTKSELLHCMTWLVIDLSYELYGNLIMQKVLQVKKIIITFYYVVMQNQDYHCIRNI